MVIEGDVLGKLSWESSLFIKGILLKASKTVLLVYLHDSTKLFWSFT